jgi:hypothetical protein
MGGHVAVHVHVRWVFMLFLARPNPPKVLYTGRERTLGSLCANMHMGLNLTHVHVHALSSSRLDLMNIGRLWLSHQGSISTYKRCLSRRESSGACSAVEDIHAKRFLLACIIRALLSRS